MRILLLLLAVCSGCHCSRVTIRYAGAEIDITREPIGSEKEKPCSDPCLPKMPTSTYYAFPF
jgi:hypothetical protein